MHAARRALEDGAMKLTQALVAALLLLSGCAKQATTGSLADPSASAPSSPSAVEAPPAVIIAARVKAPHCLALDVKGCAAKCTAGDPVSCVRLARIGSLAEGPAIAGMAAPAVAPGTGPKPEDQRAILGSACNVRYGTACQLLAHMLESGRGGTKDAAGAAFLHTAAVTLLPAECDAGDSESCALLADAYALGNGLPKDQATADRISARVPELKGKACSGGDISACSDYGLDVSSKDEKNAKTGVVYLKKACDGGDGFGCEWLAKHYAEGRGVAKDATKAKAFFKKACADGVARACSTGK